MTLFPAVASAQVDQFVFYYNGNNTPVANPPGGTGFPAIGGFAYDPVANVFYNGTFGGAGQGIYRVPATPNPTADLYVQTTNWTQQFLISTDVTTGAIDGSASATSIIGDVLLNPAPLTIGPAGNTITYAPGTLAIITDGGKATSGTVSGPLTKIVYAYDLRKIGGPAGTGRDWNGDGIAQWNDVFYPIATFADQKAVSGNPSSNSNGMNRRHAFSSDGQSIYILDISTAYGGLYKVPLTTSGGPMTKLIALTQPNTEPAVVPTSVRDFSGGTGPAGDQIVIQGGTDIGNAGGLSYFVDTGTTFSAANTILTAKQFAAFFDVAGASADIRSVTSDEAGNLYLLNTDGPAGIFLYDTAGRLVKLASNAEQRVFNRAQGVNTNANMLDLKLRTSAADPTLKEVLFSDNNLRAPAGVTVYRPGDFNRDGVVDIQDANLLKGKLGLRGVVKASIGTTSPFTQVNTADLKYDLNGSMTVNNVAGVAIDWKDVKIFQQFAGLSDGDVDMDFDVDAADLATLAANYNGTGKLFTQGNLTSVRIAAADRDDVNFADLVTLAANWTAAKPAAGPLGAIPAADLDRAFAITAGGTISQYQAKGSGAWSNAANWTGGIVPNTPGAVASLLTKPQDDTTITLDGTYTVGQLNFDNYFTYTLTGGAIRLQGANGSAAELNAFAASPVIQSAVEVNSNASVNVTYAADTVTIGGPLTVAAGQTLTKAGPGTLRLTGGGTSGGTLALTAGTTVVTAPLTVGGLTLTPGTTLDLTTAGITVTSGETSVAASLITALASGYNGGNWNGLGINSSAAAADATDLTALGYVAGPTSFVIDHTYYGDANLDGAVDADDFALIDKGAATGASVWWLGDFNYSGTVTSDDYLLIDRSHAMLNGGVLSAPLLAQREAQFGAGYVAALVASVPEPVALPTLAAAGLAMTARRRRSR